MLDLTVPDHATPAPLVIHIYGGAFATGSRKHGPLGRYLAGRLPAAGFALAHVEHRHSGEAPFPAQLHDLKAAVRWLRRHSTALGLDPTGFAAWGTSSGGHLATMLAVTGDRPDLDGVVGLTGVSRRRAGRGQLERPGRPSAVAQHRWCARCDRGVIPGR